MAGMNVGELFVSLGIKGADKTVKTLIDVKDSLFDVSASGLAAKAAIVGIIYAIEQLTVSSAQLGAGFKQFGAYTGLGLDKLQKWQQFLLPFQVQGKAVENTLSGIQQKLFRVSQHMEAPPVGFRFLGIENTDDALKVFDKALAYARSEKNAARANEILGSIGFSPDVIAAFRRVKGSVEDVKAPMNQSEIDRLDRINQKWLMFAKNLELFKAGLASTFGGPLLDTLQRALTLFEHMATAFQKWGTAQKGVAAIAASLTALFAALAIAGGPITALSAVITGLIYLMSEYQKKQEGGVSSIFGSKKDDILGKGTKDKDITSLRDFMNSSKFAEAVIPKAYGAGKVVNNVQNNIVNQDISHHGDASDTKAVGDTHNSAAKNAAKANKHAYQGFPTGFQYT